jgi:hypothetical protein
MTCFSYDAATQQLAPPFEVGSPEFWTGLAYSGDYLYLGPTSSTGACSGTASVVPCDSAAQSGSYPFYTFNGTLLNFGANWSWATELFGGPYIEFNALGTMNQYLSLFVDELSNTSRAGFVAPGTTFDVRARVQDLGTVALVNLSYDLPGVGPANETMHVLFGTASDGTYLATVPATGGNGTISFRVWARNNAGALVELPAAGAPPATVDRIPIPTVTVGILTSPAGCGGVSIGGGPYLGNGTNTSVLAGFYTVGERGCYPYRFQGWVTTGGVSVNGTTPSAQLTAHANGTVEALFAYHRPLDRVVVVGAPSGCGTVTLNGTAYPAGTGTNVFLLDAGSYSLSAQACTGKSFSGWTVSNPANLSVLGNELTLHGNGTLLASFVSTTGSFRVQFETDPASCGGVRLGNVAYVSGQSVVLAPGNYSIGPDPCAGWGFAGNVTPAGSVSVANGTLSVSGAGTVTYSYYRLTLVTIVTSPSDCGAIAWDGTAYGNGVVLNVTNHTQHSIATDPCSGTYLVSLSSTGAVTLEGTVAVVDGPGTIEAAFRSGSPHYVVSFVTDPTTCGSILFNGVGYSNSQYSAVVPDTIATLAATACTGYGFVGWSHDPGLSIEGGVVYVNASGSITARFQPLVNVLIFTSPVGCGSIVLDGQSVLNNGTAVVPENDPLSISAIPCAYQALSQWIVSVGASISGSLLTVAGPATVTAVFVPAQYSVRLLIASGGCGQVLLGSSPYGNNSTVLLTEGEYAIGTSLCGGYALEAWQTTANLSVSGSSSGTLNVRGSGTVTAVIGAVPPSLVVSAPPNALAGSSVSLSVVVAVLIAPYDYNYSWSFGDGTNTTTIGNTTTHTYGQTGTFTVRVTVTDPLGRHATAETNVTIVTASGGLSLGLGTTGAIVLGTAAGAVVVGAAVAVWRSRREVPKEEESDGSSVPEPSVDELEPLPPPPDF